jgi:hypothetical protein
MYKQIIFKFLSFFNLELKKKNLNYFPIEANNFERKIIRKSLNYSMTNNLRMFTLIKAFKYIIKNKIKGDFVECGVWKGGNLILLQNLIEKYAIYNKKIYAYDTFMGMSKFSKSDYTDNFVHASDVLKADKKTLCYSSLEDFKNNFYSNTKFNKNLTIIKGEVEKTLREKKNVPKKISILRLDTDYYSSTKIELEILWPRLSKGGILIIDDYGYWRGCKKAVDEFFYKKDPLLLHIDESCRILIKN